MPFIRKILRKFYESLVGVCGKQNTLYSPPSPNQDNIVSSRGYLHFPSIELFDSTSLASHIIILPWQIDYVNAWKYDLVT